MKDYYDLMHGEIYVPEKEPNILVAFGLVVGIFALAIGFAIIL